MSFKNTQQDKYQKFTNQLNDCEAISEIKVKLDHVPETPAQFDDQGAELIESQSQIKFFLEELDNKQEEVQLENKDDDAEEYEPILNTQINIDQKNIIQQKKQQNQNHMQTLLQVKEKLQNKQMMEPLPSDNKLNQDIIQDDIDISQSKLCKSLLKNINDQVNQEDNEYIIQLYNELNELKQKNKEMYIQNEFYQQELKRIKEQHLQDMNKQKQIFENEILQLKSQLILAKKVNKQDPQNLTLVSFQERQMILKDMLNKITEKQNQKQEQTSNDKSQNQIKNVSNQIVDNQPLEQKSLQQVNLEQQKQQEINKNQQKEDLQQQQTDKKKRNSKEQESLPKQTNVSEKKANQPPPPNKKQTKQVRKIQPDIKQDQQLQSQQIQIENQSQQNREVQSIKQVSENPEDFFNHLSNQTQQKGLEVQSFIVNQQNDMKQSKDDFHDKSQNQSQIESKDNDKNTAILQPPINNNLLNNEKNSQITQYDPLSVSQNQTHNQIQKQIPKQRRVNQNGNGVQNVPSFVFD